VVVFDQTDRGRVDSHGGVPTKGEFYLWVADRAADVIVVVDVATDMVVNEIALAGALSDRPAPDLLDISPDGNWVFMALRGPLPLTGNVPAANNAMGATPGLGVVRVERNGADGRFVAIARVSHIVEGAEAADPHAVGVCRR
jgi:hypothetical protein